jgi:TonB family protein
METPPKTPDLSRPDDPDDGLSHLLVTQLEVPWYRTLIESVRDLIHPPKLPPLELTSKPVPVKDIWGLYGRQKKSFLMSTGFQLAVVATLLLLGATKPGREAVVKAVTLVMPLETPPDIAPKKDILNGGGGGGDRSPLPPSFGKYPKPSLRQYAPPAAVFNNPNPKLMMDASIIAPPDIALPQVDSVVYGDPLSKFRIPSNGPGSGSGIGTGDRGGDGPGRGPGTGPGDDSGFGNGRSRPGYTITKPELLHKVEPEYSEDARKAKYSGTVVLYIEIDATGHATNIRVQRSLGMGLDEKAVEAVKKWLFVPGKENGKPVTVPATVEVNFRLL